jgi:N-acetylmuramoyl-L-alanine amidase
MKLGIVVGHHAGAQGAFSTTLNASEYPWNRDLAARVEALPSAVARKVFLRDNGGIAGAYAASDQWGSDITVELHFNASHHPTSTGTGMLYLAGSARGKRFAQRLFNRIDAVLGLGAWPQGTSGAITPFQASGQQMRGQGSLTAGRAPATLIEPFFGSNPSDARTAAAHKDDLARAILQAAEDWFAGL